jgi:hypothetical protein
LRCTAVTSLHRTKAGKPPTTNEFAISHEEGGCHSSEIYHGYLLNMRLIEACTISNILRLGEPLISTMDHRFRKIQVGIKRNFT